MKKKFLSNLIPSVLAFTLAGVYVIVDGLFVGNACGDDGISAINIAWPLVAVMQSLGTGIGTGGAVMFNINKSSGHTDAALKYCRSTFTLIIIAAIVVVPVLLLTLTHTLELFGASGITLELGYRYARIMILGGVFQLVATGIVPMIRNNGGARFAMITMVSGFVFNIIFDWLLVIVIPLGVEGAAYASIGGQLLTTILGISYLTRKGLPIFKPFFGGHLYAKIAKLGASAFGLALCPSISLLFMNRYCVVLGGAEMLAAYAVIAYVTSIAYCVMQGVAEGTQPLISESYSIGDADLLRRYRRMTYMSVEFAAALCSGILFILRSDIGPMFGTSNAAAQLIDSHMWIFLVGMFFLGFVKVTSALFYATEHALCASVMAYAEPVFVVLILLIVPKFLGINGVWIAEALAQMLNAAIGVLLLRKTS